MLTLVNLTKKNVVIDIRETDHQITIAPEGIVAKIKDIPAGFSNDGRALVMHTTKNLPDPKKNTIYIVHETVTYYNDKRDDLISLKQEE